MGADERLQRHPARCACAARRRRLQLGPLGPLHGAMAVAQRLGAPQGSRHLAAGSPPARPSTPGPRPAGPSASASRPVTSTSCAPSPSCAGAARPTAPRATRPPAAPSAPRRPALSGAHPLEPDPDRVDRGLDDPLARHLGVVDPPDRQPGQSGAHHLRGHLQRLLSAPAMFAAPCSPPRIAPSAARAGPEPRRGPPAPPGRRSSPGSTCARRRGALHVARPGVERPRHAHLGRLVAGQLLAPHREQLVAGALEQAPVEVELRVEVVVDHGRRDARAPGDLVHARALVTALGEHLGRGRSMTSRRSAASRVASPV